MSRERKIKKGITMKELHYRFGGQKDKFVYKNLQVNFSGFLKIVSFEVDESDHRKEMMVRQDAVVVLPIHWKKREVYLIEQPRHVMAFGSNAEGRELLEKAFRDGWTTEDSLELPRSSVAPLEMPAGIMDVDGESSEETAVRELEEETGLIVGTDSLEHIASYYPSVGGTREIHHTYFCSLPEKGPIRFAQSLSEEDRERVSVYRLGFDDIYEMLDKKQVNGATANVLFRELFIRDRLGKKSLTST